jgi:CHAD domain-containing protein
MVSPDTTVGDLATDVLQKQTAAFLQHSPGVREGQQPEAVHQMRVAARRMRAALRWFRDVLPTASASHLKGELKWIAALLGEARDLDVQLGRLQTIGQKLDLTAPTGCYAAWLVDQRQLAQQRLEEALGSPRYADLVQTLRAVPTWGLPEAAARPLAEDAPDRLRHVFDAFRKRARKLSPDAPDPEFHAVRIHAKRLRYAAEFVKPLYGEPAAQFSAELSKLQDILGELQDSVVGDERMRAASTTVEPAWPPETLLALGEILRYDARRRTTLKRRFGKRYEAVVGKPWKRLESAAAIP